MCLNPDDDSRMKQIFISISLVQTVFISAAFSADSSSVDQIKGQFTFDSAGKKCYAIESKKIATLKKKAYTCDLTHLLETGGGKKYVNCTNVNGKGDIMVFKSKEDCASESADQAANSEEP
jgi:hypothetical protein